jgi:hypothetical protein
MDEPGSLSKSFSPTLAPKVSVREPHDHSGFKVITVFLLSKDGYMPSPMWLIGRRQDEKRSKPRIKIGHLVRAFNDDGSLGELFWMKELAPEPVEGFPFIPCRRPCAYLVRY